MKSIPPHVFVSFDSCGFSPPIMEEKLATEKLLTLIEEHQVQFSIPEAVLEETNRAPDSVKKIAQAQIYDYDLFTTQGEQRELSEVKIMLFQTVDGISLGKVNDARILLCAKKYGCTYFVTFDKKHILSKRIEIKSKLGFEVVTPSECLEKLLTYLG
ncbi:MAG: type II toxin-antitoxin system VapC family toxin [Anaerolineaceae bacterium]|nr:type II toxin-antitoxin system VapC family toxin [Anaerolineaceae bacterium]